jgi:hypothetical protein
MDNFHQLSGYERRLWVEVDRILYQNYLTPKTVTDFWEGDREAIVAHLKQMKERVIRLIVLSEYVEIDEMLGRIIVRSLDLPARSWRKRAAVIAMLDRLYPLQKLDIVAAHKHVPKSIANNVRGMNDLRNTFAHRFHLHRVSKSKKLYKGQFDLFTKAGLKRFRDDMWDVQEYFDPKVAKSSLELVAAQRAYLRRSKA